MTHLDKRDHHRGDLASLVTAALALAIVLGSPVLWIGMPFGGFWLAGPFTTSPRTSCSSTPGGIPLPMVPSAWVLYRVNALYLRFLGRRGPPERSHSAWLVSETDERAQRAPGAGARAG